MRVDSSGRPISERPPEVEVDTVEDGVVFILGSIWLGCNTQRYPNPAAAPKASLDFWNVRRFPGTVVSFIISHQLIDMLETRSRRRT